MPHWVEKKGSGGNSESCADPSSESKQRDFKHGQFGNNAKVVSAEEQFGEGSRGLALDQGAYDTAIEIQHDPKGKIGQKVNRIKTEAQGSHAQLGDSPKKVSRERV